MFAEKYDVFLFDLDGVIYIGNQGRGVASVSFILSRLIDVPESKSELNKTSQRSVA